MTAILSPITQCIVLLTLSNVFMTFAWYAHLKNLSERPWWIAALVSWGIAFFEYVLQVPANRIGYTALSPRAAQDPAGSDHARGVRALRRSSTCKEPLKLDYLWAALCMLGAVYFIFRGER